MQSSILTERCSLGLKPREIEKVPSGMPSLDRLTGGLPRGGITEIIGPASSGRTSTMMSILAQATAAGEVCALVDGGDAFDPISADVLGADLSRILWVRCRKLEHVLKSTDLLLQGGGFGRVVMDMTDLPPPHVRSVPLASWFRFQRTIEKTPSVLVVMGMESVVKSAAALVVRMRGSGGEWSTILSGLKSRAEIVRARGVSP